MNLRTFWLRTDFNRKNSGIFEMDYPWWLRAIISSLTGVILSIIVSLFFALSSNLNVPVIGNVERLGADMGALVHAKMLPDDPIGSGRPGTMALPRYVFLDVDEKACESFVSSEENARRICRLQNPVSSDLTAAAIRAARSAEAAVLIIDVAPFESREEREIVMQALDDSMPKTEVETWIVAPPAGRHKLENGALWGDRETDLRPKTDDVKFKLATMGMSTDPDADDEKIRRVSRSAEVFEANGQGRRVLPSAPYLAALRLRAVIDAGQGRLRDNQEALRRIDCQAYGEGCKANVRASATKLSDPITFSMMSLSQEAAEQMRSDSQFEQSFSNSELIAMNRRYERIVASRILSNGTKPAFELSVAQYRGAVIVLGSSMVSAGDLHATPIGVAAGSEIVLNAVRTFLENPGHAKQSQGDVLWAKLHSVLIGFSVMGVTWAAVYWILSRERNPTIVKMVLRRLTVTVIFIAGMASALGIELLSLSYSLSQGEVVGDVDVLTPVVALGLDGYASAVKYLTKGIEHALGFAFVALLALWARIRSASTQSQSTEKP